LSLVREEGTSNTKNFSSKKRPSEIWTDRKEEKKERRGEA
jgi:hypothetical protein